MASFTFVVLTNPVEGHEDEFNEWYTDTHLDDVLALGPYVSARRFKLVDADGSSGSPYRYMALYEVEAESAAEASRVLIEAVDTPAMPMSKALDMGPGRLAGWYFEAITDVKHQRVTVEP